MSKKPVTPRKRGKKPEKPRKVCSDCRKPKDLTYFWKVDSPLFPDGLINICRDCVKKNIDETDMQQVITFLRQIDKPFIQELWDSAVAHSRPTLSEYVRKVNSLPQVKNKSFDDSKGSNGVGTASEILSANMPDVITSDQGREIKYSDILISKWGIGYNKQEYLKMEKFYQDMIDTHEIHTPVHKDELMQLAKLSIKRNRLLEADDMPNYEKANRAFQTMMKSSGFTPADRQGLDDATGMRSFSQIFEEVEKRGWRKPPPPTFDEDIVDQMIVSLLNYYHRLVGKQILSQIPDEVKQELDDFYEDDLTPVELNDEEYEDLDFTVEDEDDVYEED